MTLTVRCCEDINFDFAFSRTVTKPFFPADETAASRQRRLSHWKICLLAVSLWYSRVMEKVCKLMKQEIENARLDIKKMRGRKKSYYCTCMSERSVIESDKLNSEDVGNCLGLIEVKIELINNDIINFSHCFTTAGSSDINKLLKYSNTFWELRTNSILCIFIF